MKTDALGTLSFTKANQYSWQILLVGIALGVANYSLGIWNNLGTSIILQVTISALIGYPLLLLASNYALVGERFPEKGPRLAVTTLLMTFIGFLGTQGQEIVRNLIDPTTPFTWWAPGGSYAFNVILTVVLGFGLLSWAQKDTPEELQETEEDKSFPDRIPVKKGEAVALVPVREVLYLEAYDNYSFVYDTAGDRYLCSHALGFMEQQLGDGFLRVHRKYLIHKSRVSTITPHLKGRYVIEFEATGKPTIISSGGYTEAVRSLIRL